MYCTYSDERLVNVGLHTEIHTLGETLFLYFLHSSMAVIAIHILRDPGANCGAEGSLRNEQYIDPNLLSFWRVLLGQEDLVTTPAVHASLFEHRKTFVYREIYFC